MKCVQILVLFLAACGSTVTTDPIEADFPLGPSSVRRAVTTRFQGTVAPDAATWPADASAVTTEVVADTDASVDVAARKSAWAGKVVDVDAATLAATTDASLFTSADLYVGNLDAVGPDSDGVRLVAHAPVSGKGGETQPFVWADGGRSALVAAIQGGLDTTQKSRFVLFLRGRATVTLQPGAPLPGGAADGTLRVVIPVRAGP